MSILELLLFLVAAIAYFVPYYIARYRKVNGLQIVFWLNLFLAWTLFAWILLIIVAISLRTNKD